MWPRASPPPAAGENIDSHPQRRHVAVASSPTSRTTSSNETGSASSIRSGDTTPSAAQDPGLGGERPSGRPRGGPAGKGRHNRFGSASCRGGRHCRRRRRAIAFIACAVTILGGEALAPGVIDRTRPAPLRWETRGGQPLGVTFRPVNSYNNSRSGIERRRPIASLLSQTPPVVRRLVCRRLRDPAPTRASRPTL